MIYKNKEKYPKGMHKNGEAFVICGAIQAGVDCTLEYKIFFSGMGLFNAYLRVNHSELIKVVIKFQLPLAAQRCRWWTVCHKPSPISL